jgi:hypothetical protein
MRNGTLAVLIIAALATAGAHAGTDTGARPVSSGTQYSQPDLRLEGYDKILIEEPTLQYDETSAYRAPNTALSKAAAAALREASGERFTVVTEAAPGVVRLRAAITNVRAEEKPRRFWQYTPVGLIKSRVDTARGTNVTLYGATVEIELVDALTGRSLATVVDTDDYASWRDVVARLDWWVRHIIDDPQRWV